ncbi:hypothetical protein DES53_102511 [Roseimicrobium gellanilyticum]|uniref:DUF1559 domain-containing protein n=1 Tax=Roseimicrobium gellanilyticum TaxID=748857 RepID=A0A366HR28_9BACT|nr:hypothetical protein [Roseimicrobium gellanilyticum]RBP46125.1 hypothetical protein DES53_102511 [Roseimicrobium gellanilyticum]
MSDVIKPNRSRFGCLHILVVLTAACLLASMFIPTFGRISKRGNITIGISNCRQIITALRMYSSDHGGKYPDAALANPQSSNEVFRILFQKNIIDNELMLGCPMSQFVPDGDIGKAPSFKQAVEAGENHWAMTSGLSDSASGSIPLVFENPVIATWSPKWNVDAKGTKTRGRSWSSGVIVGMNDSSVGIQPLDSKSGTAVPLKDMGEGTNLFTQHGDSSVSTGFTILDVEVKP